MITWTGRLTKSIRQPVGCSPPCPLLGHHVNNLNTCRWLVRPLYGLSIAFCLIDNNFCKAAAGVEPVACQALCHHVAERCRASLWQQWWLWPGQQWAAEPALRCAGLVLRSLCCCVHFVVTTGLSTLQAGVMAFRCPARNCGCGKQNDSAHQWAAAHRVHSLATQSTC